MMLEAHLDYVYTQNENPWINICFYVYIQILKLEEIVAVFFVYLYIQFYIVYIYYHYYTLLLLLLLYSFLLPFSGLFSSLWSYI